MVRSFFALLCSLFSIASFAQHVNIATGHWPPFMDENDPDKGCVAKLLRDALRLENIDVRFEFMPWQRAYIEGQKPRYAGTAYWYFSEERANTYLYSKYPITYEVNLFYHLKDNPMTAKNFSDLEGKILVLTKGLTYPKNLLEIIAQKKISVIETTYTTQNLPLVLAKRGDVAILNTHTADAYLQTLSDEERNQVVAHTTPAFTMSGYMLFNHKNKDIAEKFDRAMELLFENSAYLEEYQKRCPPLPSSPPQKQEASVL